MTEIQLATEIQPGSYVKRWRDTVAGVRANGDGTVTFRHD